MLSIEERKKMFQTCTLYALCKQGVGCQGSVTTPFRDSLKIPDVMSKKQDSNNGAFPRGYSSQVRQFLLFLCKREKFIFFIFPFSTARSVINLQIPQFSLLPGLFFLIAPYNLRFFLPLPAICPQIPFSQKSFTRSFCHCLPFRNSHLEGFSFIMELQI